MVTNNTVILTDDELTAIVASLKLSIMGHERHLEVYGKDSLDSVSKNAIKEVRAIHDRLTKEFF